MHAGIWYSAYTAQTITVAAVDAANYRISGQGFAPFTCDAPYLLAHILRYRKYVRLGSISGVFQHG